MKLPWVVLVLLRLAATELTEEQCGSRVLRQIRGAEQQAWCCALYGHCRNGTAGNSTERNSTAMRRAMGEGAQRMLFSQDVIRVGATVYDCNDGLNNVHLYWDVEKQAHCCAELGMGCPQNAFDCESGYMNWVHGWSPGKKIWCCEHTERGCPVTTVTISTTRTMTVTSTFPGCQRHCTLENVEVTCEERIHFASVNTFLGEASPCQLAHELVLRECKGLCDTCPISVACLGAANVPTSTPEPTAAPTTSLGGPIGKDPFDCHEGLEMWQMVWFPAKQEWCCNHKALGCPGEKRVLEDWEEEGPEDLEDPDQDDDGWSQPGANRPQMSVATWGAVLSSMAVMTVALAALWKRSTPHPYDDLELIE